MYERILVGTDGSDTAREAVRHAAEIARGSGATLHLLMSARSPALAYAAPDPSVATAAAEAQAAARERAAATVEAQAADLRARGLAVETHVASGDPADALCETARTIGAQLIVVGNKGMQGTRRLLGSIPNSVSHHAPCSVLIVRTT